MSKWRAIKSEIKLSDGISVMASCLSCRMQKASEFSKMSTTFSHLLHSVRVTINSESEMKKKEPILKMFCTDLKFNLPICQKGLPVL